MSHMNFKNPILENIFKNFKWARNNTIEIFDTAVLNNILEYTPISNFEFQSILFQFQCIVATTDVYIRKMKGKKEANFGELINNGQNIQKRDISVQLVKEQLKMQIFELQDMLSKWDDNTVERKLTLFQSVNSHEYLHQGQLTVMVREAGVDLPLRFRKAWSI